MQTIKSNFFVAAETSFENSEAYYITMEILGDYDLRAFKSFYNILSLKVIKFIIACIIQGLEDIHSYGILHKDIKPANLIFDKNWYLKISDFGVSKEI